MNKINSLLNSLPLQGKDAAKGFTLVELIVTISILAILGTIAFISLQGYSRTARDSTRISNLSTMKSSLELFNLDSGKYPNTTSGFDVTYSGAIVWTQGIFGEDTKNNLDRLDKLPLDPLVNKEYTYSITKTKQEYQLAGMIEGSDIVLNSFNTQTNAGEAIATAIVTGKYNGQTLKAQTGGNCKILSVPSIISSEEKTVTDLTVILDGEKLVYNGYNNLPSNYKGSKYKTGEGFKFTSKKLIVYSDDEGCAPLYNPTNAISRVKLVKNLQTAYSGTIIEKQHNISKLVNIDTSDLDSINILSASIINNNMGGKIVPSKAEIISCEEGFIYQNGECSTILPSCEVGYSYNTLRDTCEVNPTCTSGYGYNSSTKLCQKTESTSVSPTGSCSVSISVYQYGETGSVSPGGEVNLYHYNGGAAGGIYSKTIFNNNCRITSVGSIRYGERTTRSVSFDPGEGTTSQVPFTSISRVQNTTSVSCPGGYTRSGSNCSRTLTESPTCLSNGILNTSTNQCQLAATCNLGVLDTSLDSCVEN